MSGIVYLLIYLLAIGDIVLSRVPLVDEALLAALWLNLRRMGSAAEAPEDRDHTVRAAGA